MVRNRVFSCRKEDFDVDWFNGTGGGGQHRNKNANCCRLRHKETGFITTGQSQRSRIQNQKEAFRKMVKLLMAHYIPKVQKERGDLNEKHTRTYNECENYVKDHLTGEQFSYKHTVGKGDLSEIIENRQRKMVVEDE